MSIVPLYGHDALRRRLFSALERRSLPASLLLHGPQGIGKQRLALWLGQTLVCESDRPPCGRCQQCRFALELAHPDIHWFFPRPRLKDADATPAEVRADLSDAIAERLKAGGLYAPTDGTAGIFVATVRALVRAASVSPAMARRRVFIIGDADRMVPQEGTEHAANAVLKLLEEPPPDSYIILTSSEPGALLPTIRSRVVHVRVPRLGPADVEAFFADTTVRDWVRANAGSARGADLVADANGAPGAILGSADRAGAVAAAQRMLDAALAEDRARALRVAFAQGGSRARGAFSDALDELVVLLTEQARAALSRGDERVARGASRAVASVEEAKAMAAGNVSPALVTATLLRELAAALT